MHIHQRCIYSFWGIILMLTPASALQAQQEVRIGSQIWSRENLRVDTFRNGDRIPQAATPEEWMQAGDDGKPAWCYYNNDPANGKKYGKLYNWFAVNDPRGLAPAGWHIPSDEEWKKMAASLGGESVAAIKLRSKTGWDNPAVTTNASGFSALPGGARSYSGDFNGVGYTGRFWSSTRFNDFKAGCWYITADVSNLYFGNGLKDGYSVRCVKD